MRPPLENDRIFSAAGNAAIGFFLVVLLALSPLRAGEEIEFAVPDDGRITLGVFDGSGKLVRVLHRLAKEEEFRAGDNGLITTWDGNNDAGERVAAGHYSVRGYLVGDAVRVSGEAFLFNDWAADPGFPGFNKILDFSLLENGDVILLAGGVPSGDLLARFSPDKGFLWSCKIAPTFGSVRFPPGTRQTDFAGHPVGGSVIALFPSAQPLSFPPQLATNASLAFVIAGGGTGLYALDDGKQRDWIPQGSGVPPLALAANDSRMFVSSRGGLVEGTLPVLSHEDVTHPPSAFTSMDADASALIGASTDGVWIRKESFKPVTLSASAKSVALGTLGTFWFVGVQGGAEFVGQATFAGEILRTLRPLAGDPKPEKIRASRTAEKFTVLESLPGLQRMRVMAREAGGGWTIECERTLCESANFGFVGGKPAADVGGAAQDKDIRVRLKENPLTGKHGFLTLHPESDTTGTRLISPDGLPLVEVSAGNDIRRVAIQRGDNSLRLLQGNGLFVEEFSIAGLDDILPLDAGGIDLP